MTAPDSVIPAWFADPDPEARRRGAQRIRDIEGPEAVALLERALGDEDWRVRKEAAMVAPAVLPRDLVVDSLLALLGDRENVALRNAAVEALIGIGRDAVAGAVEALGQLDPDGRKLVVDVLGGVPDLAGTRALAQALDDPDVNVRAAAAEALGTAGQAGTEAQALAIAALSSALSADEPLRRLAALNSLTRLEANLAWDVFEPLTKDPLLRRYAIAAAGHTHEAAAIAALARAIGDPSIAVARDALVAVVDCLSDDVGREEFAKVARHEIRAMPLAEERIRAFASSIDDSRIRGAALVALGLLRTPSDVPTLVGGLSDEDVSDCAELGLRWFGHDALPSLIEEGRRAAPPVRAVTLSLIPVLTDRPDVPTLDALREALHSASPEVLTAGIQAIALTGNGSDLPLLAPYATNPDARVAATTCSAMNSLAGRYPHEARMLARTIPADSPAAIVGCLLRGASASRSAPIFDSDRSRDDGSDITFLRAALDHNDVHVRRAAVDALASIGGPKAADAVARALADEARDVVLAAIRALGRIGISEPLLSLLEGTGDPAVTAAALRALGEANPNRAFDAAWGLLQNRDPLLASSAVETIGQLRGARRDDGLFIALEHPDPDVVKSALVELSRDMSPRTIARVGTCLDCASYEIRRFAAELLGSSDDPAAELLIRARLDRESDPVVREALNLALVPRGARGAGV